jgi:hypothetical protein
MSSDTYPANPLDAARYLLDEVERDEKFVPELDAMYDAASDLLAAAERGSADTITRALRNGRAALDAYRAASEAA